MQQWSFTATASYSVCTETTFYAELKRRDSKAGDCVQFCPCDVRCISTAPPHVFVRFIVVPCSILFSFGLCDAEKSRNMLSVLKCPPTMRCRFTVSLLRPDGSCSVTGHLVHNRMCIYSCCCTWRWAPSFVRVVGLVFTITTDRCSSAPNGMFVRVQILASQQTPLPPLPCLRSCCYGVAPSI
jgi:hypothetical protein